MDEKNLQHKEYEIFVNKKRLLVSENTLSGKQILEIAGLNPAEYDLYRVQGQKSEPIQQNQEVKIENGLHFNAILKSAPYGSCK
ncbi:MAG: multiubiquitin domain-containing protein [Thermoplasmata archaeon]